MLAAATAAGVRRHFAYHAWAGRALAAALTDEEAHERARAYLAHAFTADRVWLLRLRGAPSMGIVLWPALWAAEIVGLAHQNEEGYRAYLAPLTDEDLAQGVRYTNMQGEPFATAARDILTHVLLHGAYHRGQAAAALRAVGTAPPATDYIVWVRAAQDNAARLFDEAPPA